MDEEPFKHEFHKMKEEIGRAIRQRILGEVMPLTVDRLVDQFQPGVSFILVPAPHILQVFRIFGALLASTEP